ncbi:zinc finger BED domain-containing protein 1-like, partial [Numida meleagris]|uniref:zinc finger BED domain-containing protein 1-like n=1 Tax=Numida meleagris TaxID=8996 RepID=UPI000B3E28C1
LLLEVIFRDLQPLSVVKDRGFGLLLGYLEPGFGLPTPAQLAGALRRKYGAAKLQLERYVRAARSLVLCAELWAAQPGRGYVTVSASFIDAQWRRARCVLGTRPGEDDGDLEEGLRAALDEFGLDGSTVLCVVHDGERGAGGCRAGPGWRVLGCAARTLQQCVVAGLRAQRVQEALSAARGLVAYFQRDAEAAAALGGKLEAIHKGRGMLVTDAGSRWLSTAEMCESLLELKWAVMAVLEERPRGAGGLAEREWKLLQELVPVLRTAKLAASFLSEEQNGSVSALLPCVHGLAAAVGRQAEEAGAAVREAVGNVRAELARRWEAEEEGEEALESPAVIAAFLDPRFKELRFLSPGLRSALHARVKDMLSQAAGPQPSQSSQSSQSARSRAPSSELEAESGETGAKEQSVYDVLLGKDPTESMPEIHQQLENYIVEPLCKRGTDPLRWWKQNEHRFPAVARLGRQYLAVPATAAPPHRAFADGQSALQHRRAALEPEHLHHILFLHHNAELLEAVMRSGAETRRGNPR